MVACFHACAGVLSGEKQRLGRACVYTCSHDSLCEGRGEVNGTHARACRYDFVEIVEWFAERADMILLLFDAHKVRWGQLGRAAADD
jgi:hypothetical protein